MLGHASAAMTFDTYADLFEHGLDEVATQLNAAMPLVATPSGPRTRHAQPRQPQNADCSVIRQARSHPRCSILAVSNLARRTLQTAVVGASINSVRGKKAATDAIRAVSPQKNVWSESRRMRAWRNSESPLATLADRLHGLVYK